MKARHKVWFFLKCVIQLYPIYAIEAYRIKKINAIGVLTCATVPDDEVLLQNKQISYVNQRLDQLFSHIWATYFIKI